MSLHLFHVRDWLARFPPVAWALTQLREYTIGALGQGPVPQHVAFVMDGNRRFARTHHIETVEGHNLGFEALARVLEVCYKSGVRVVTIYAFSIENFKRSKYEVDHLMEMAKLKLMQLLQHGALLDEYGASVRVLGQRELVKPDVLEIVDKAVDLTKGNKKAILNICFPYTSHEEIATAIRGAVREYTKPLPPPVKRNFSESHIARNIRVQHLSALPDETSSQDRSRSPSPASYPEGTAESTESATLNTAMTPTDVKAGIGQVQSSVSYPDPEQITDKTITSHLYTAGSPPLDLLVRTSGVERLSDFLLWQCHENTRIVFLECMWPEFDLWHFLPVLLEWQWWQRKEQEGKRATVRARKRTKIQ